MVLVDTTSRDTIPLSISKYHLLQNHMLQQELYEFAVMQMRGLANTGERVTVNPFTS
jgi:hypothetical protein